MEETEGTDSEWEMVEDSRSEHDDIVSKYNMKDYSKIGESSTAENHEFHLKSQRFFKGCLERGIFLEGLVASVFMDDCSLTDVFESGISKATNFSELGDMQTVMSAVRQWCMKLHTKSGRKRSQQVAWCHKNGFKEGKFKQIDDQLRDRYTEAIGLVSDLKRPTILNFNKDVLLVHETMMEIMAELWFNRLCIYQGHKDLGYMQISSKVTGLIGRKSCYRLTNEPPRFVLALDVLTKDHIPEDLNLLLCIRTELVASILSKYHNATPKEMVDQFFCIPVATEHMSFELGSLASSEKFCDRLKLISGHVIKVTYDRALKQLNVLCPKVGCDKVKSVLEEELKNLQMELETKVLEVPFPNVYSSLRLQIGEGLECLGITGFQQCRDKQLQEVNVRECCSNSDTSVAAKICPTHEGEGNCMKQQGLESLCIYQNSSATENAVEYECYTESLIAKEILFHNIVAFDSSVEVILHCLIKDKVNEEKNGNVSMSFKDAKSVVIDGLIQVFSEFGLKADGSENSTYIWAQANSNNPNQFDLKLVFPNVHAAMTGARCIESLSKSNFSVFLRHPTKLATDLKTIRIMITQNLYHGIEKPLQELLSRLHLKNHVESSSVNHSNINLQVLVTVVATESCHMHNLIETLQDFFEPTSITFDLLQLHYLQSNDGTKFLKFLMYFTNTCIYLPEFHKKAYIYGDPSGKKQSASILKRQLAAKPNEFHKKAYIYGDPSGKKQSASILKRQLAAKPNSCELSWYLFDFDKTCFNSHALKILFHKMRSYLDKIKCDGDISQYFLFEDRPELWLETRSYVFNRYSEELKSTLQQQTDVAVDIRRPSLKLMCLVCFREDLEASNKNCYLLSVCGHAYCSECLLQLVIQSTKDRNGPVKCAFQNCNKAVSAAELRNVWGLVQYNDTRKVLEDVLKSFILKNATSFGFCPRCKCVALCVVYQRDKMKACMWCQGKFCLLCDDKFHATRACDEDWSVKYWLKEDGCNRKYCPNCRIAIEKQEGCNVVFCAWCKKYICWKCGLFHSDASDECHKHLLKCGPCY